MCRAMAARRVLGPPLWGVPSHLDTGRVVLFRGGVAAGDGVEQRVRLGQHVIDIWAVATLGLRTHGLSRAGGWAREISQGGRRAGSQWWHGWRVVPLQGSRKAEEGFYVAIHDPEQPTSCRRSHVCRGSPACVPAGRLTLARPFAVQAVHRHIMSHLNPSRTRATGQGLAGVLREAMLPLLAAHWPTGPLNLTEKAIGSVLAANGVKPLPWQYCQRSVICGTRERGLEYAQERFGFEETFAADGPQRGHDWMLDRQNCCALAH